MAHFALVNADNIVVEVLAVPDEQEHRGHDFLTNDLKIVIEGCRWLQCSYNNKVRGVFPGPGYLYDPAKDIFIMPDERPIIPPSETSYFDE